MQNDQDILAQLEGLRGALPDMAECHRLDDLLHTVANRTKDILSEHEGMSMELLGLYEQIGAVFDIARRFPTARDPRQVILLMLDTVSHSFGGFVVELSWTEDDFKNLKLSPGVTKFVRECIDEHVVAVLDIADDPEMEGYEEILAAPVGPNNETICTFLIKRPATSPVMKASDMSLMEVLSTFCGDLIANIRLHQELRQISVDLVRSLVSTVDQKDKYTCGHSLRVGFYARWLGEALGHNAEELQMLEWSALLHDVGKIGIRDEVLKKPGKLTDAEFDHIKEHPVRSFDVVKRIPQLENALDGIRHHHEKFNGRGYPDGLAGDAIPLQARIIQVADIFDALTSSRSYRKAFDWQKALSILEEEAGVTSDPRLVSIFAELIRGRFATDESAWEQMTRFGVDENVDPIDTHIVRLED